MKAIIQLVLAAIVTVFPVEMIFADPGDPVAIRRSDGCFAIESMWNLSVQIVTAEQFRTTPLEGVDLVRTPSEMPSLLLRSRQDAKRGATLDKTLDRRANDDSATWTETSQWKHPTPNAIRVRVTGPVIVIDLDGVRITYIDHNARELDADARELAEGTDVLIVGPARETSPRDAATILASDLIESRILVLTADDGEAADRNTVAAGAMDDKQAGESDRKRRTVLLHHRPLTLPVEIEKLMTAKEAACRASQEVFAALSTTQMNFRPSNGSHTPRWNAEHMMGRELLFFSQIFSARDAEIPVMDLNPQQMPPDYVARHPDWTGMEEARQMQRVSAFTSRFAYLLKDLPLDQKAPGSNWTLRGLLRQMDRHYSEHTANVKKKFKLPDWPKESR